jgi:cytoskeletal protein CcmA (bactofilin family)
MNNNLIINNMAKIEITSNVNAISRISAGTVIKGEILSPSDIRIDGTFEGKLQAKGRVVIGETAVIKGDIVCVNIDLWGKVDGNIYVKDTLALKEGCVVNGNLHIKKLAVELGSTFNGNCKMITESEFDKLCGVQTAAPKAVAPQPQQTPAQAHAN